MVEVPSMAALSIDQLKPRSIVFNDYRKDELADPATGLIRFEDWARARPLQKQVLSLIRATSSRWSPPRSAASPRLRRKSSRSMWRKARFVLGKPPGGARPHRYVTLAYLERLDPAIKHRVMRRARSMPVKHPELPHLRHPGRDWCAANMQGICTQSRYKFRRAAARRHLAGEQAAGE